MKHMLWEPKEKEIKIGLSHKMLSRISVVVVMALVMNKQAESSTVFPNILIFDA